MVNRSDGGRQREHNMEVLNRQPIGQGRLEPLLRGAGLALRTMPVAAAVVGNLAVPAVAAAFDMATQGRRSAAANRPHDLELATAQMLSIMLAIDVAVAPENIRHLQHRPRHGMRLKRAAPPSNSRDRAGSRSSRSCGPRPAYSAPSLKGCCGRATPG